MINNLAEGSSDAVILPLNHEVGYTPICHSAISKVKTVHLIET